MSVIIEGVSCDICAQEIDISAPVRILHLVCETGLYLSLEQLEAIKSVMFHQYIHYDNTEAHRVMKLIIDFIDESKKRVQ